MEIDIDKVYARAVELAKERYHRPFDDLPVRKQCGLYWEAENDVRNHLINSVDIFMGCKNGN